MTGVPALTTAQMIEVDRAMIETYHIQLVQMMENAGRHLAQLARERFLREGFRGRPVVVLAGRGGNGGGALVAARHLHNWGTDVTVVLARPADAYTGVPGLQLDAIRRLAIPLIDVAVAQALPSADLIVDGLIGYSLDGAPTGPAAALIQLANAQRAPILSLDVPSGLDATTGRAALPTIRAAATMTLALPKVGLTQPGAGGYVGELYLADIGVPAELYRAVLGLDVPRLFVEREVIRVGP